MQLNAIPNYTGRAHINAINDVFNQFDVMKLCGQEEDPYITEAEDVADLINHENYSAVCAIMHVFSRRFTHSRVARIDNLQFYRQLQAVQRTLT